MKRILLIAAIVLFIFTFFLPLNAKKPGVISGIAVFEAEPCECHCGQAGDCKYIILK